MHGPGRRAHQEHVGDDVGEGQGHEGRDGEEDAEDFADDVLGCCRLPDAQADHVVAEEAAQDFLAKVSAGLCFCRRDGVSRRCGIVKEIGLQCSHRCEYQMPHFALSCTISSSAVIFYRFRYSLF